MGHNTCKSMGAVLCVVRRYACYACTANTGTIHTAEIHVGLVFLWLDLAKDSCPTKDLLPF